MKKAFSAKRSCGNGSGRKGKEGGDDLGRSSSSEGEGKMGI